MSRLARRAVIATKGGGGGTTPYDDFVAHITALATAGAVGWGDAPGVGKYKTTAAAETGSMAGSPWLYTFNRSARPCRIVQHGMPSQAAFNLLIAGGLDVYIELVDPGTTGSLTGLTRNGYTSSTGSSGTHSRCASLIYWDGTQAMQMNPLAGTGPAPYTW